MIEVWRNAARFDPSLSSAVGWAMTMTHRRAVERVRAARATATRDHSDRADHTAAMASHQPQIDKVGDADGTSVAREQVRRCLEALNPLQRQPLLLAYYEGRTYQETADLLGTAPSTVKTLLLDSLVSLRRSLAATSTGEPGILAAGQ